MIPSKYERVANIKMLEYKWTGKPYQKDHCEWDTFLMQYFYDHLEYLRIPLTTNELINDDFLYDAIKINNEETGFPNITLVDKNGRKTKTLKVKLNQVMKRLTKKGYFIEKQTIDPVYKDYSPKSKVFGPKRKRKDYEYSPETLVKMDLKRQKIAEEKKAKDELEKERFKQKLEFINLCESNKKQDAIERSQILAKYFNGKRPRFDPIIKSLTQMQAKK